MIHSLSIRNYVIIDQLEMQFSGGFTTITGETGAGKSILMGALGLILGNRVEPSVLKLKDSPMVHCDPHLKKMTWISNPLPS
jgi:DNA repair protein RecN (Recombination protein N)